MLSILTFSFTSSSASASSSSSGVLLSPFLTTLDGRSHASFIDFRPKNKRRVTAAYSPIGTAVGRPHKAETLVTSNLDQLSVRVKRELNTTEQRLPETKSVELK